MEDIKPAIIIAVISGTRSLGIAVFKDLELIYYGVKEASKHRLKHTPHSRAREAVRAVEQVIYKYQPSHFITLNLNPAQRLSAKLPVIADGITRVARHLRLTLHTYERKEIRRHLCPDRRASRQTIAIQLSTLYPELSRQAKEVSLWQRLYYARMFDAVAIGYVHASKLERDRERLELARLDRQSHIINTSAYETGTRTQKPYDYPRPLPGTHTGAAARSRRLPQTFHIRH